jgi:hypothetical protein
MDDNALNYWLGKEDVHRQRWNGDGAIRVLVNPTVEKSCNVTGPINMFGWSLIVMFYHGS